MFALVRTSSVIVYTLLYCVFTKQALHRHVVGHLEHTSARKSLLQFKRKLQHQIIPVVLYLSYEEFLLFSFYDFDMVDEFNFHQNSVRTGGCCHVFNRTCKPGRVRQCPTKKNEIFRFGIHIRKLLFFSVQSNEIYLNRQILNCQTKDICVHQLLKRGNSIFADFKLFSNSKGQKRKLFATLTLLRENPIITMANFPH